MEPLISIIVPVYNQEKYLAKCLESIINQTYKNIEIIVINDGSIDATAQICHEFARKDSRIRVITKGNEGLVRARKDGLRAANGMYIGYVDSDDWIDSDMYAGLYELAKQYNSDVVCAGRVEEYDHRSEIKCNIIPSGCYTGDGLKKLYESMLFSGIFFKFGVFPTVWDKLFKREILEKYQMTVPDEVAIGEDVACTFPCLINAKSIYISDNCWYHYRIHSNSMLGTVDPRYNERTFILQNYLNKSIVGHVAFEILQPQIKAYISDMVLNGARKEYNYRFDHSYFHQYLFPFENVDKGSSVVIYGAGHVGQTYYRQIHNNSYAKLIAVVDKASGSREGIDIAVKPIEFIDELEFDVIVIAVLNEKQAEEIIEELMARGVPRDRMLWRNPVVM